VMHRATSNRITFIAPKPSSVSFRAQSERLIAGGVCMTLVYRKLIFAILLFPLADNTIFLNVARCGRVKTVNYFAPSERLGSNLSHRPIV